MTNSQINKKNMERARNVSQKGNFAHCGNSHPEELRLMEIKNTIRRGTPITIADWKLVSKEMNLSLRTAYGIYISMCKEQGISRIISWRTFYMQCNGYRTLKANTIMALTRYINVSL